MKIVTTLILCSIIAQGNPITFNGQTQIPMALLDSVQDSQTLLKQIRTSPVSYIEYEMPVNNFKSYMSYKAITDTSSVQYQLQQEAYTDTDTGFRMIGDRICVAVGTGIGASVGAEIELLMESGDVVPAIVGDIKADWHTDSQNIATVHNGCVAEFIVDTACLPQIVKQMGDASYATEVLDCGIKTIRVSN